MNERSTPKPRPACHITIVSADGGEDHLPVSRRLIGLVADSLARAAATDLLPDAVVFVQVAEHRYCVADLGRSQPTWRQVRPEPVTPENQSLRRDDCVPVVRAYVAGRF